MKTAFPQLSPETSEFKAEFPSAGRELFFRLLIILFCFFCIVFFGSYFVSMIRGTAEQSHRIFFLAPFLLLVFIFIIMHIFLKDLRKFPVFSVSLHKDILKLKCPLQTSEFPISELKIRNEFPVGSNVPRGLSLYSTQGRLFAAISAKGEEEIQFLSDLSSWLEQKGIPVINHKEIIPSSARSFFLSTCNLTVSGIISIFLTSFLVMAGLFWIPWLLNADVNLLSFRVLGLGIGLPAGLILFWVPLRIWFWKLTALPWFMKNKTQKCIPVKIMEDSIFSLGFGKDRKAGILIEKDNLFISTRDREWKIPRESVVEIERMKKWKFLPGPERFMKRPVFLCWKDEQGFGHSILVCMVHGWIALKDHLLEKRLLKILKEWHQGKPVSDVEKTLSPGPRFITALFMIGFIVSGILAVSLHNYALNRFVRTGIWSPILKKDPPQDLVPLCPGVQALSPGRLLLRKYDPNSQSPSQMFKQWIGDPVTKEFRPVSLAWFDIIPSFPGRATHFLYKDQISWGFLMIPPIHELPRESSPRLLSLETGRAFEIPLTASSWVTKSMALYQDEKIFYSEFIPGRLDSKANLFWYDIKEKITHFIGEMEVKKEQPPLFFPGGHHVLYDWKVVSLETGAIIPVSLPHEPIAPELSAIPAFLAFPMKDKLCFKIRYKNGDDLSYDIWEIDPVTAQVRDLLTFPHGINLVSADEKRFLLRQRFEEEDYSQLLIYDRDTGTSQTLFREDASMHYHSLVTGTDKILSFTDTGILIHALPKNVPSNR